jgi:small-conductance mechanosensitive channel
MSRHATANYQARLSSSSSATSSQAASASEDASAKEKTDHHTAQAKKAVEMQKKTMAQLDEELRLKLEGISGDGGASGVEYENGKASGLKRNVKANMFRVI